jgi:hypothetical protein
MVTPVLLKRVLVLVPQKNTSMSVTRLLTPSQ